jgi:Peptidase family M28
MTRPTALPGPDLVPSFDGHAAAALVADLESARLDLNRTAGSNADLDSANWFRAQMAPFGLPTTTDDFTASVPGMGRVRLRNVSALVPGRSPQTILVTAHRDTGGEGPVVYRDDASGTAALLEIARGYTRSGTTAVKPEHTILFLSTDGGVLGNLGARHFVEHARAAKQVVAVVNLDTLATSGRVRIEFSGPGPHSASSTLLGSTIARIGAETGASPGRPSAFGQLLDLAFPLSFYGQWPFLEHGISAITITTAGDRPTSDPPVDRLDVNRLGQAGAAAQALVSSLDRGLELSQGTGPYLFAAGRIVRGWALALLLVALVVPFAVAAVDLFARCRRRHVALGPAFRSCRRRIGLWLWLGALFGLFALFGAFPNGVSVPPDPASAAAGTWPRLALTVFAVLAVASWLVARGRLASPRAATAEEELAGQTAALLVLGLISLLVIATNVYALVFLVPSLHAWLWLPQVRNRHAVVRGLVFAAGLLGPIAFLALTAKRFALGFDTPWYLAELTAIGYVPIVGVVLALAWAGVAAQLFAVTIGRYAAYPNAADGAPPGFVRAAVRTLVLGVRNRRRPATARRAYEGH